MFTTIQLYISIGLSIVSLACDIVMIANFIYVSAKSNKDNYDHFFIISIAIHDGIRNIAKLCWVLIQNEFGCLLQAFLINYGGIGVFWWMGSISIIICTSLANFPKTIVDEIKKKKKRKIVILNVLATLFFSLLPLITLSYGHGGTPWCWINSENDGMLPFWFISKNKQKLPGAWSWFTFWGVISFYAHLIISYLLCISSIIMGCRRLKTNNGNVRCTRLRHTYDRLKRYPLCLLPWIFPLIRRSYEMISHEKAGFYLTIPHTIASGSMGVLIICCYGRIKIHKYMYNKIHKLICKQTDEDATISDQVVLVQIGVVQRDGQTSLIHTVKDSSSSSHKQKKYSDLSIAAHEQDCGFIKSSRENPQR